MQPSHACTLSSQQARHRAHQSQGVTAAAVSPAQSCMYVPDQRRLAAQRQRLGQSRAASRLAVPDAQEMGAQVGHEADGYDCA